jgi:hypothetical protein
VLLVGLSAPSAPVDPLEKVWARAIKEKTGVSSRNRAELIMVQPPRVRRI